MKLAEQLRDKIIEQTREFIDNNKAIEAEKELNEIIQNCKSVPKSLDASTITKYKSRNESFSYRFTESGPYCPKCSSGMIFEDQIEKMFGEFNGRKTHNKHLRN